MRNPWQWLKSIFARGEDPRLQRRFVLPYPMAGVNLTADDTLSLAATWACIDVITRNIASCRWNIYQEVAGPKNRRTLLKDDPKAWMLNTRPNPEMTAIGFREAMLFQAIPFGNSYAEIEFDMGGRPRALWPLISDRMYPRRNPDTKALEYEYIYPNGERTIFSQDEIFHVRGPGIWGLMGDNLVARAAKSLAVAAAQERFTASYFGQGASPLGVLEFPNKLGSDQHKLLMDDWAEKHKGPENAHKPLILESGMKWTPIGVDPQKSQLVEGRKFSIEEICRWFGVPPHKVQHLDHATFSNIEHSSIEFVRDALVPWACRLSQEADAKLFDQTRSPWKYTEIDLRPLTHGDAVSRAQAHASWRQNGILSANEIRALEGYDDVGPDGDVLLANGTLKPVEQLLEPPPPPPPTLPGQLPGTAPVPDESEDDDAPDDAEPASEGGARALAKRALCVALVSAMLRYERKLLNRQKSNGAADAKFCDAQRAVAFAELTPFAEFARLTVGRDLTRADVDRAADIVERDGIARVSFTPHQLLPA